MAQAVVSSVKSLVSETWPQPRNAVHLFTLKGIQWKFQAFRLGEGGGEGSHPDPEIRGAVSKKFFSALRIWIRHWHTCMLTKQVNFW